MFGVRALDFEFWCGFSFWCIDCEWFGCGLILAVGLADWLVFASFA